MHEHYVHISANLLETKHGIEKAEVYHTHLAYVHVHPLSIATSYPQASVYVYHIGIAEGPAGPVAHQTNVRVCTVSQNLT